MADHVTGKTAGTFPENKGKRYIVKGMNPLGGSVVFSQFQGDFGLDILAAQIHVSQHGAAVSGLQITVMYEVEKFLSDIIDGQFSQSQVHEGDDERTVYQGAGMGQQMMNQQPMMAQPMMTQPVNVQQAQFQAFTNDLNPAFQSENIDLIMDVPLEVTVELGRTSKSIQDILDFAPGTIIELNKIAGEPIDVLVNGKYVAKGEVVVIEESYGIRITDIVK